MEKLNHIHTIQNGLLHGRSRITSFAGAVRRSGVTDIVGDDLGVGCHTGDGEHRAIEINPQGVAGDRAGGVRTMTFAIFRGHWFQAAIFRE